MQAIITKYLPATNFRGARIKASCERGSLTISQPIELSWEACHKEACNQLVAKFVKEDAARYGSERNPWSKPRVCGQLPSGDYVHVAADPEQQMVIHFADHSDLTAFKNYHGLAVKTDGTVGGLRCGLMCSALKRSVI